MCKKLKIYFCILNKEGDTTNYRAFIQLPTITIPKDLINTFIIKIGGSDDTKHYLRLWNDPINTIQLFLDNKNKEEQSFQYYLSVDLKQRSIYKPPTSKTIEKILTTCFYDILPYLYHKDPPPYKTLFISQIEQDIFLECLEKVLKIPIEEIKKDNACGKLILWELGKILNIKYKKEM